MNVSRTAWLIVILAGCAADGPDASAPDDAPPAPETLEASEQPLEHAGCTGIELFFTVTAMQAAPHLPPGFALATDPGTAVVGAYECPVGGRAFLAFGVQPPPELVASSNHFWEPEHLLAANTTLATAMVEARANVTWADIEVQVAPTATSFVVEAPDATYRYEGAAGGVEGTAGAFAALLPFREYAPGLGGVSYIDASFDGADGVLAPTVGTLRTTGDSPTARLFGASVEAGGVAGTTYEYANARVGFVPWP